MPFNLNPGAKIKFLQSILELSKIFLQLVTILFKLIVDPLGEADSLEDYSNRTCVLESGEEVPISYCQQCAKRDKKKYTHPFEFRKRKNIRPTSSTSVKIEDHPSPKEDSFGEDTSDL